MGILVLFMKRKIIQLAGKTLVVSLPSKWAKNYGIKKGQEIEVIEKGKSLIICTDKEFELAKTKINLSGPEEFIAKRISTAYKRGYDELELNYDDASVIKLIKKELENLMGYEIVKQGEKYCIVKNIAIQMDQEFENLLRRVFLMLLEMAQEGLGAIKNQELLRIDDIASLEETNDKLTNICKRILNKNSYKEPEKTSLVYSIIWQLEKIADDYEEILRKISDSKLKLSKETLNYFEKINLFLKTFYELYYDFDENKGKKLTNERIKLLKDGENLLKNRNESIIIYHLLNILNKTYDMTGPYYAIALKII